MFYAIIATVTSVFALLVLFFGLRLLIQGTWFWGWARGMVGVLFLVLAGSLGMAALDLYSYQQVLVDKPIATISFEKVDKQAFIATLVESESGRVADFYLRGDQWQIDARIIRWKGPLRTVGGKPGYRLDRIGGRYYSIEDERSRERTVHSLRDEREYGLDLWAWANQSQGKAPLMDAVYGSATFLPMADGALYEVALSQSGLVAKPLNDAAKKAVDFWLY